MAVRPVSRTYEDVDIEKTSLDLGKKPGKRRHFASQYHKLKNEDSVSSKVLNLSVDDAFLSYQRELGKENLEEIWQHYKERNKRRLAICEDHPSDRQAFTKIVQTHILRRNMNEYGLDV